MARAPTRKLRAGRPATAGAAGMPTTVVEPSGTASALATVWATAIWPSATACHRGVDSAVPAGVNVRKLEGSTPTARVCPCPRVTRPTASSSVAVAPVALVTAATAAGVRATLEETKTSGATRPARGDTGSPLTTGTTAGAVGLGAALVTGAGARLLDCSTGLAMTALAADGAADGAAGGRPPDTPEHPGSATTARSAPATAAPVVRLGWGRVREATALSCPVGIARAGPLP